jgi:hypothetical protein
MIPMASAWKLVSYGVKDTSWKSTYWKVENSREEEEKENVEQIDRSNRNIESISLLIHVWFHNTNGDEERSFNDDQSNSLEDGTLLSKSNEKTLDEKIAKNNSNEIVHAGLELDVEKAPLVQRVWIRVENVSWVFVHAD